jgi:cytoskeletal protein RodZ
MEAFDEHGFEPPALVADIAERPQARSTDILVRIATYAIVTGLAVLVVMWWNSQQVEPARPFRAAAPTPRAVEPVPVEPGPVEPGPLESATRPTDGDKESTRLARAAVEPRELSGAGAGDETEAVTLPEASPGHESDGWPLRVAGTEDAPEEALGASSIPAAGDPAMATEQTIEAVPPATEAAAPTGEVVVPSEEVATPPVEDVALTGEAVAPAGEAAASEGAAPGTGAGLAMSFGQESWVEVYDRRDAKLFYDLVQPGRVLELHGPPPLRVVIGNAKDVSIEFDGRPFDYQPFSERGVARFVLGAPDAAPEPADASNAGEIEASTRPD